MSMESKCIKEVTAWAVVDALEELSNIKRIIVAAHYLDGYDIEHIGDLIGMTAYGVEVELNEAMSYIRSWCTEYELMHNMKLTGVEGDILRKAFSILFKRKKYIVDEGTSMWLHDLIYEYVGV